MSLPAFKGIVTVTPWQQAGIAASSTDSKNYGIFTEKISWQSSVPPSLQNLTINQITNSDITFRFEIDYVFTVKSGSQVFECSATTSLNMNFYKINRNSVNPPVLITNHNFPSLQQAGGGSLQAGTNQYCISNTCPTFSYNTIVNKESIEQDLNSGIIPGSFSIELGPNNSTCSQYGITNLTFEITANISLFVTCQTSTELESDFCFNYCTFNEDNLKTCYPQYRNYCLINPSSSGDINIFTNENCQNFFKDYFSTVLPNSTTDNDLTIACSKKFPMPSLDVYDNATNVEKNICACHLPVEFYDNLQKSLIAEFPGFQFDPEDKRCLFPPCPSSNYLTQKIGKACTLPACINLAAVTNNGTIKGGINLKQNNACVNAANGKFGDGNGDRGFPEEAKTWIENHWVWLVLGISILVILIIVILIVLAGDGNKNNKKKKQM